ncbi:MAG: hypothetical protein GHCLOJNM_01556 [bacterium]|nr:hypothetical protein [bacterium]
MSNEVTTKQHSEAILMTKWALGTILANAAAHAGLPEVYQGDLTTVCIALAGLALAGLHSVWKDFGVMIDVVGAVVTAAELERAGKPSGERYDYAVSLVSAELEKRNVGWLKRLVSKPIISAAVKYAAAPLKRLLYRTPPVK